MTTIKNLRDEDGLFYPRTHMKAVLNNDGTNVQNLINSVNEDIAQSEIKANIITSTGDGSLYLSNDGTYKELPPIDTDEHLYITVTSNQPQPDTALYGTIIVVNDTTDNTSESFTWNGTKIHKKIPYSHVYTITTTAVEGYSTPDIKTFTAALQGSNEVELNSNTCVLSFESTVFAEVTISYDGITRLTNSSNVIKVPYGKTVTVTPHAVEGYTTPSAFTVNADAASKTITLNYIQSQLKVNILSNQGEDDTIDVVEATVKYGSTSVKITNGQTIAVPSDTTISISFPEVEGYKKPEDITFNHTNGISEKSGTYKCELLTVNVSADQGSVSGFEVTISKQETIGVATKYTRLEYIESSGSQYIDTGFKPNQDTRVVADMYLLQNNSSVSANELFGARTSTSSKAFAVQYNNTRGKLQYFYGGGYTELSASLPSEKAVCDANKNNLSYNGTEISRSYSAFQCDYSLYLFALNNAGSVSFQSIARMYSCQIYDNETMVHDYIPALRSDGIAGLYDAVNDTFYASNSSSNFSYGSIEPTIVATQTSVTGSYKIPFDTGYTVQAGKVSGYTTPASITRVANVKSYTVTQQYTLVTEIDLSLQDIYGNPINRSTANCYVVREVGTYKFPLVYGNAIKNGKVNTAAFTNNGGSYSHDFLDGRGDVITNPYIDNIQTDAINWASSRSLGSDFNNLISNITIVSDGDYRYIQFEVNNIPSTGANAIIYLGSDIALWSWHIWVWPHDLTPVEITNSTGVKYNIMPVNLASKYDDDGVHIKNWFYQWGRKDPMPLPSAWNSTTEHDVFNQMGVGYTTTSKATDIDEGVAYPSVFYYNSTSPYNWFGTKSYYNLWDAACTGTGHSDNDTVKTVYDPCPVGWKIPNGNAFTGLSKISVANGIVKFTRYSGDSTGVGFPMSGYRYDSNGSLYNVGSGGYVWLSSASSQLGAYLMGIGSSGGNPQSNLARASGCSVRPVQDDGIYQIQQINFKIDSKTYYAEAGMTWFEWLNSDYNTDGYYTTGSSIYNPSGTKTIETVHIYDNIVNGTSYVLTSAEIE